MKSKFIGILLILLIIGNVATLGIFWYYKVHGNAQRNQRPGGDAAGFIIKQVGFNAGQQAAYHKLVEMHQQNVKAIQNQLHEAKDSFFDTLSDTTTLQTTIDAKAAQLGNLEKQLDEQTYQHFKQVRALCTPAQKTKFDNCLKQVMRMMGPQQPPRGPQGPPPMGRGDGSLPPPGQGPPPDGQLPPPPPPGQ